MTAVESAHKASEATRQLCHDLYQPVDVHEAYSIVSALGEVQRQLEQTARMLADRVRALDPSAHRDDRESYTDGLSVTDTLLVASDLIRTSSLADAMNELSHVGSRP